MTTLAIGQQAALTRIFTPDDVAAYRELTGDAGLQPGVPGPLLSGLFSCLLGTTLPGRGTNWLKQSLAFVRPAHPGEAITATVTVSRLRPEKDLVNLRTVCTDAAGAPICEGEALVLFRETENMDSGVEAG